MTHAEGVGVSRMLALLTSIASRSSRETIRGFVDGLTDDELSAVMDAASAADVATGGVGNLLYESAAARLRGVDVEQFGSGNQKKRTRST